MQRAEDLLNTPIEVYKNDAIEDKKNRLSDKYRQIYRRAVGDNRSRPAAVDAEIENYKKKNRLTDIDSLKAPVSAKFEHALIRKG